MKVILSPQADADLESIGDWIARDNPRRATTFVNELMLACEDLGEHPFLYAIVPGSRTLRKKLMSPYAIFYRIRRSNVAIVSIRHGARDDRGVR